MKEAVEKDINEILQDHGLERKNRPITKTPKFETIRKDRICDLIECLRTIIKDFFTKSISTCISQVTQDTVVHKIQWIKGERERSSVLNVRFAMLL